MEEGARDRERRDRRRRRRSPRPRRRRPDEDGRATLQGGAGRGEDGPELRGGDRRVSEEARERPIEEPVESRGDRRRGTSPRGSPRGIRARRARVAPRRGHRELVEGVRGPRARSCASAGGLRTPPPPATPRDPAGCGARRDRARGRSRASSRDSRARCRRSSGPSAPEAALPGQPRDRFLEDVGGGLGVACLEAAHGADRLAVPVAQSRSRDPTAQDGARADAEAGRRARRRSRQGLASPPAPLPGRRRP